MSFPELLPGYTPTLASLHAYARAMEAVPRAHGVPHPRWWHIGLMPGVSALRTAPVALPDGGEFTSVMDLKSLEIVVRAPDEEHRLSMGAGLTAPEMAERIIVVAMERGLPGPYDRSRFADSAPRQLEPGAVAAYSAAFDAALAVLQHRREMLGDRVSPILMWPHEFDMSFERYGDRTVVEAGVEYHTQINLGFYPADDPYIYSSPWPFEPGLVDVPLPHGAVWNTVGWTGARLPYHAVVGSDGSEVVAEFAAAVFAAAAPGLGIG